MLYIHYYIYSASKFYINLQAVQRCAYAMTRLAAAIKTETTMSKENISIHEFEFDVIFDYFSRTERQGPGSDAAVTTDDTKA